MNIKGKFRDMLIKQFMKNRRGAGSPHRKLIFKMIISLSEPDFFVCDSAHATYAFTRGVSIMGSYGAFNTKFYDLSDPESVGKALTELTINICDRINTANDLEYGLRGMTHKDIFREYTSHDITSTMSSIIDSVYGEISLDVVRAIIVNLAPGWDYCGDVTELTAPIASCLNAKDKRTLNMEFKLAKMGEIQ